MKKLILTLVIAICSVAALSARDNYSRDPSILPQAAQNVISTQFKAKVSIIKVDKTMGRVDEYEVVLTDGTEITFDRSGNWKDIETSASTAVPKTFVPKGVADYVAKNHKSRKIVGIEQDRGGYEIELSDGIDIKFDRQGNFKRYD